MPSTSSTTAPPRIVTPSGVSSRPMSASTRALTATEVVAMIAPRNNARGSAGLLARPKAMATATPSANDRRFPPTATSAAAWL